MKTMTVRYSENTETRLALESGQVASTKEAGGLALECLRGALWITFEDGGLDHVLNPGERIQIRAGGRVVIEAMAKSELVFYRQAAVAEPVGVSTLHASANTPECWRNFVGGLALPRTNFDSAF